MTEINYRQNSHQRFELHGHGPVDHYLNVMVPLVEHRMSLLPDRSGVGVCGNIGRETAFQQSRNLRFVLLIRHLRFELIYALRLDIELRIRFREQEHPAFSRRQAHALVPRALDHLLYKEALRFRLCVDHACPDVSKHTRSGAGLHTPCSHHKLVGIVRERIAIEVTVDAHVLEAALLQQSPDICRV